MLVTAEAQTAGRGRQGRAWVAPAGSSALLSFVLRLPGEAAALLPLAAAVAVCEACERSSPVACAIKWPNDVWIDGGKVAGILLEGRPQEGWAVLGIGINVALRAGDLPEDLRETATSLAEAGGNAPSVEEVLAAVTSSLDRWLSAEPGAVLEAWRARDALHGRPVRWNAGEGVAEGISASGALVVRCGRRRVELHAGEVSLVRPGDET
jgi:BirA family biotin operon repressor/biotin-[acetyl-CoA-carboxylase] ligase